MRNLKKMHENIVLDVLNYLYQAKHGIELLKFENNVKFSIVINNWHRWQLLEGYVDMFLSSHSIQHDA